MEEVIPPDVSGLAETARRNRVRKASRYRVVTAQASHPVMELTDAGFVIEADGRPPLRGFVDIYRDKHQVMRHLVTCRWAEDGLVGYEFKRDTAGCQVPVDHVAPAHAGLLAGPD